jgi:hypothetical protein
MSIIGCEVKPADRTHRLCSHERLRAACVVSLRYFPGLDFSIVAISGRVKPSPEGFYQEVE